MDKIAPERIEGSCAVDLPEELKKRTAVCPFCGKTALKNKYTKDQYFCYSCYEPLDADEVLDAK